MIIASEIAIACCAGGARFSGRNQKTIGTTMHRTRPQMTSDRGGRSSNVAGWTAGSSGVAIVSVVKQTPVA
jgi:hypothetical protein